MDKSVILRVFRKRPVFLQPPADRLLQIRIGIRDQAADILRGVFVGKRAPAVKRTVLFGQPVNGPQRLAGIVEIFFQRSSFPVSVSVIAQKHSFRVLKQGDKGGCPILFHAFNQFSADRGDHIRHGRAVPGKIPDKFRFRKVILFRPVAQRRDPEHIFLLSVQAADIHQVSPALMAGHRPQFVIIKRIPFFCFFCHPLSVPFPYLITVTICCFTERAGISEYHNFDIPVYLSFRPRMIMDSGKPP